MARFWLLLAICVGICIDSSLGGRVKGMFCNGEDVPLPEDELADWCVCFYHGEKEAADKFAEKNGLEVVRRVIPFSSCFQLTPKVKLVDSTGFGVTGTRVNAHSNR